MKQRTLQELRALVEAGGPYPRRLLDELKDDVRAGAQQLYAICRDFQRAVRIEKRRLKRMMSHERQAKELGFTVIAGVDEAGRGPLAGPIVAGAVVLDRPLEGLNDSKQVAPEERERLYDALHDGKHWLGVGIVSAEEIDRVGIQTANYAAMAAAVAQLDPPPQFLLVDGFNLPGVVQPQLRLIKGDARSLSIAAASILAKVTRDRIMVEMDRQYPGYGFASHKGYTTPQHLDALDRLGPCPIHRRSFAPVSRGAETAMLFEFDEV